MALTAIPSTPEEPEGAPLRTVANGLRHLIVSGQRFRDERARELQLGASDMTALGHLYHAGPMSPGTLAGLMGVTSGTMTALLDRVERAGFLRREHNPEDRRGLHIHLTPAGRHAMKWLYGEYEDVIREALSRVPGLAVDQFLTALETLSEALDSGHEQRSPAADDAAPNGPTPIHPA